MRGALQFIGMMLRGGVLLSAIGAFTHCVFQPAVRPLDLIIILIGFALCFADIIHQVILIIKDGKAPNNERLYLVNFIFDGGHGVRIIKAKGINEGTQKQVYSAFLEKIEQNNPELDKITISSISEVPGK